MYIIALYQKGKQNSIDTAFRVKTKGNMIVEYTSILNYR